MGLVACDNVQILLVDSVVTDEKVTTGLPLLKRFPRHSLGSAAGSRLVELRWAEPAREREEVQVAKGLGVVELVEEDVEGEGAARRFERGRTRGGGS